MFFYPASIHRLPLKSHGWPASCAWGSCSWHNTLLHFRWSSSWKDWNLCCWLNDVISTSFFIQPACFRENPGAWNFLMIERDCSVIYSYWPCNILHTSPCVSWLGTFIWIQLISVYLYYYCYMLYCPTISYNINLKTNEQCSNPEMSSLYTGWLRTNFPQQIVLIPNVMNSITPCNNQPTLNQQGFWALLKWSQNYSNQLHPHQHSIQMPWNHHKIDETNTSFSLPKRQRFVLQGLLHTKSMVSSVVPALPEHCLTHCSRKRAAELSPARWWKLDTCIYNINLYYIIICY